MAGGDAHAGPAAQIPHRPAERRRGLQPGIEPGGDAVGRQYPRCLPRKEIAFDTAVVGNGHGLGQVRSVQVVGQALGGPADGVDVHAVGPRADHTPEPSGPKGQIPVKAVGNRRGIVLHRAQLGGQIAVFPGPAEPEVQICLIVHSQFPFVVKSF